MPLPKGVVPLALVPFGYPAEPLKKRPNRYKKRAFILTPGKIELLFVGKVKKYQTSKRCFGDSETRLR